MHFRLAITVSAVALALAAGCKTQSEQIDTTKTTSAAAPETTSMAGGVSTAVSTGVSTAPTAESVTSEDKEFMTEASQRSLLQIALGTDAAARASSPAVREFGERMVKDHTKADNELQQLAIKKGVSLPTDLDAQHKGELDRLAKLKGKDFDREYSKLMISGHENDVKAFQKESSDAKDLDLRSWASNTVPILEQNLVEAQSLKAKTK